MPAFLLSHHRFHESSRSRGNKVEVAVAMRLAVPVTITIVATAAVGERGRRERMLIARPANTARNWLNAHT